MIVGQLFPVVEEELVVEVERAFVPEADFQVEAKEEFEVQTGFVSAVLVVVFSPPSFHNWVY